MRNHKAFPVFICSARRSEEQEYICKFFSGCKIHYVVPHVEFKKYSRNLPKGTVVISQHWGYLPEANQMALEVAHTLGYKKMLMCDDDAVFYQKDSSRGPLRKIYDGSTMVSQLFSLETILAGVGQDRAHHGQMFPLAPNKPITTLQMIDVIRFRRLGIRFDRVPTHQDTDVFLQSLRLGFKTWVLTRYVIKTPQTKQIGGCDYRNAEMFNLAAKRMADLHPGIVTTYSSKALKRWIASEPEILKIRCNYQRAAEEK